MSGLRKYLDSACRCGIHIEKSDVLDLPKTLILAHAKLENNKDEVKRLLRKDQGGRSWIDEAEGLLRKAGVTTRDPKTPYQRDDFEKMASKLPTCSYHVYERKCPSNQYSLKYRTAMTGAVINLMLFQGTYDFFVPSKTNSGFTICDYCNEGYKHVYRHQCSKKCGLCRHLRKDCYEEVKIHKPCSRCNRIFTSENCFANHLKKFKKNAMACDLMKKCTDCDALYCTRRGVHICGQTKFCKGCKSKVGGTHDCCWVPPTEKQKEELRKKQEKFTLVMYDMETVQTNRGTDTVATCSHWTNFISYVISCEQCYQLNPEDACPGNCGPDRFNYIMQQDKDDKEEVCTKFVEFLLKDSRLNNAVVIAHNGSGYDHSLLLPFLLRAKVFPRVVKNGMRLMKLEVHNCKDHREFNKLQFKDSFLLIGQSLSELSKAFGFADDNDGGVNEKLMFPYLFNHPDHYNIEFKTLPDLIYYADGYHKPKYHEKFLKWYEANKNKSFNLNDELITYGMADARILQKGVSRFIDACIKLTTYNPVIHSCTAAGFSYFVIRHLFMKEKTVGVIPEQGYGGNDRQSLLAIKYIKWLQKTTGIKYKYILNGGEQIIKVGEKKYKVDAYNSEKKVAVEVLGCFWHGCKECIEQWDCVHPCTGKTMAEMYSQTMDRIEAIRASGITVHVIWEHSINSMLQDETTGMKAFFDSVQHTTRLRPRNGFMGARTQNFKMRARKRRGFIMDHIDVTSMYPYVLLQVLPKGEPEVITCNFKKVDKDNMPYAGFLMIDSLPPKQAKFPVVGMRHEGKLLFPLCRTCAVEENQTYLCNHSDDERMLHTTIFSEELEAALKIGYQVKNLYEVWHWSEEKWDNEMFSSFVKLFMAVKMENSGYPADVITEEEKDLFIQRVRREQGIILNKDKMQNNPALRTIAKLLLNSAWGKFSEKPGKVKHVYSDLITQPSCMNDPCVNVVDAAYLDNTAILWSYKEREEFVEPLKFSNVCYGSITTSRGRIMLWECLNIVQDDAIYCDTDSCIYYRPEDPEQDPLKSVRGSLLGQWLSEVPEDHEIIDFVSTGPKVYSYKLQSTKTATQKQVVKVRGITLDMTSRQQVNFDGMCALVEGYVNGDATSIEVARPQMVKKEFGEISTVLQTKTLQPVMTKMMTNQYDTRPYGYSDPSLFVDNVQRSRIFNPQVGALYKLEDGTSVEGFDGDDEGAEVIFM